MVEDRPKKIALIGATGYEYVSPEARVKYFPWNRLKKIENLADYDLVVLNLLSLDTAGSLDPAAFRQALNVRVAYEVLRKDDSVIVVLGDPRFSLERRSRDAVYPEPFLSWTGIEFSWDDRTGDTVERKDAPSDGPFTTFADKLVRWTYSLAGCRPHDEGYAKVWDIEAMRADGEKPEVSLNVLYENSYGNALVFSVAPAVERQVRSRYAMSEQTETVALSNPILFLPESKFSEQDAVEFVLRDLLDLDVSAPEPEWVSEFAAPGQEEVDNELTEIEIRIEGLIAEQHRKVEERAVVREPLKLLYETGPALEEAVQSVLKALGAEVERPEEDRSNEDGWVTVSIGDETFEGVLEVKGVKTKHFNLEGIRQLTDWIERGWTFRKKTYTGIFVGNSSREEPPRRRIWPFTPNWVEQAEMRGYAAVRTEDLYVLYLLAQTDRLDRDSFWRELFSTTGPFKMRPYWEQLSDEEKEQLRSLPQA